MRTAVVPSCHSDGIHIQVSRVSGQCFVAAQQSYRPYVDQVLNSNEVCVDATNDWGRMAA